VSRCTDDIAIKSAFCRRQPDQLVSDLSRALDGYGHGPVTPYAIDERGPKPVTIREALTALQDRIDRFLG
jgi:hypothetical protein